jgi:hypothetical protein
MKMTTTEGYLTREYLETQLAKFRRALTWRFAVAVGLGVVLNHFWK